MRTPLLFRVWLICGACVFGQDPRPELATVSVTIVDSKTKKPLSDVEVRLLMPGSTVPPGGKTNGQGRFVQTGVSPGIYYVDTTRLVGYEHPMQFGPIEIKGGETIEVPAIRVRQTGAIQGTVSDASGKPIANVRLEAISYGALGSKRTLKVQRTALTNGNGQFNMTDIDPIGVLVRVLGSATRPRGAHFATTYYPNTTAFEQAKVVSVLSGGSVKGIDFRLGVSPTFSIRGRIAQGIESLESVVLSFQPCGNSDLRDTPTNLASIDISATNSFEIPEVLPGTYCLVFKYVDISLGAIRAFAEQVVRVTDHDVNDVILSPSPMEDVFIAVTGDRGQQVPPPRGIRLDFGAMGQLPAVVARRTTSGFYFPGVATSGYQLLIFPSPGTYIKSIKRGYKDFNDGEIRFGQDFGIVVFEVSEATNRLRVKVKGNELPPWRRIFVRADPVNGWHRFDQGYVDYTNANGEVEFKGIAPGSYTISAWSKFEAATMDWPEFRQRFKTTTVEIRDGDESTIEVNLITSDEVDEARNSL